MGDQWVKSQIGWPLVKFRFNPTIKVGSKMGGAPKTPKWDTIGFDPQPNVTYPPSKLTWQLRGGSLQKEINLSRYLPTGAM